MGFTHYWTVKRDTPPDKLAEAGREMIRVVKATRVPLADWDGAPGTEPVLEDDDGVVRFNGVGEDSHETFAWPPDLGREQAFLGPDAEGTVFTFCKTAQKPYDPVVVACLLVAERVLGDKIHISSDARDVAEFFGTEQCEGWRDVNAMLGHPTDIDHDETAGELYARVFGEPPPIPRCFAGEGVPT